MEELKFIDCHCSFGESRSLNPFLLTKKEDLKNELIRCNVQKAIVHHSMVREFHPKIGNKALMDEIKNDDFFIPCFSYMPNFSDDFMEMSDFYNELKENKVKMLMLLNGEQRFSIAEWNLKEVFETLSELKMPVVLSLNSVPSNELYEVLSNHKKLNVILKDTTYFNDKDLMHLMELCPNLYMETATYKTLDGIEYITKKFGSQRLFFASNLPFGSVGAMASQIIFANISKEEKENIAYKNIEKLIEGVII